MSEPLPSTDYIIDVIFLQEVARLKVEKLEVLGQNVAAQRKLKRLREREVQLSSDLSLASRKIERLSDMGCPSITGESGGNLGQCGTVKTVKKSNEMQVLRIKSKFSFEDFSCQNHFYF